MTLGQRIKKRREELGMSVDELAKRLGKNRATVYRYENDEIKEVPLNMIAELCAAMTCQAGYFLGWTDFTGIYDAVETAATDDAFAVYSKNDNVKQITVYSKIDEKNAGNQIILKSHSEALEVFDVSDEEFSAIKTLLKSMRVKNVTPLPLSINDTK